MATTTPIAYNPSLSPISGTTQVGTFAVGTTQQDYSINPGGVTWWMGPDEDLGYVIAIPVSGNTQPTPISGVTASVGFYRSADLTDNSFVDLTNSVFNQSFSSATEASVWLTNNGYWNSYTAPVLYLDAGNPASYPGTGTVWTDLVGGKQFNLINGPGYDPANGGKFYFYAPGGQYANCSTSLPSLPVFSTSVWHNWDGVNTGEFPCLLTEVYTGGAINYVLGAPQGAVAQGGYFNGGFQTSPQFSLTPSTWYNIVVTCDASQVVSIYLNGSLISSTPTSGTQPSSSNSGINLMKRWDFPTHWGGYLSTVNIYDKALTSGQILSNYNLTKSRYGYGPTPTPTITPTPTPSFVILTPTPTLTQTNTSTPSITNTQTPTLTPTPSTTPNPVTGYSFNLVVLPYNYPSSGNTIMVDQATPGSGTTNPNVFATTNNGIYFNAIDTNGVNRTNYFATFTGQSITLTISQTGSTAIYSGDSKAFQSWSSGGDSGFTFGYGIAQPGYSAGTTSLIQSATTNWVTGQTVTISAVVNGAGVTPTPTATSVTPTPTPTSGGTGGWLFYSPNNQPVLAPPDSSGNTTFIDTSTGFGTYNPNYTGGTLNLYFNNNTSNGTSYASQFSTLDTSGGTITISQGSSTAIYSGTSTDYQAVSSFTFLTVTSPAQMIQSASTSFVSGSTINVVVS